MSLAKDLRGLAFDMDGTLIDSEPLHKWAWRAALAEFDLPMDEQWIHGFTGKRDDDIFASLPEFFAGVDAAAFRTALYGQYARADFSLVQPVAGAREAVALAYELGLSVSVVTSATSSFARPLLEQHGYLSQLRVLVTADRVQVGKPDPQPYLLAARELGLAPSAMLGIEDSAAGLAAVRAAGMHSYSVGEPRGADFFGPDLLGLHELLVELGLTRALP